MFSRIFVRFLACLLVCPVTCAHAQSALQTTSQAWAPPSALASKLAPEVVLDGLAFRPPVGFLHKSMASTAPQETAWVFENLDHFPGLATDLYVATIKPQGTMLWSADRALPGMIQSIVQNLTNTKVTQVERGTISGYPALRCYIKGDLKLNPQMAARIGRSSLEKHLFVYVIGGGKLGITFVGEDIAPYSAETMPLLEASVLTMRWASSP